MKTKNLVALSLLVGMGAVLHAVMPGFGAGMKPDMMLTMMFLGIILFPDAKSVLLLSLSTGIISGLTTTFPGGLIPNIIDKPVTAALFFGLFLLVQKFNKSMISAAVLTAVGTLISGIVFLTSAFLIVGLPGPFTVLFGLVVLPAVLVNTITMIILYPIAQSIMKRTNLTKQSVVIPK
ncbi:hypothetical protein J2Z40_001642 [Cytobacillus eiseniae]|uniref:Tryptophan transporter n=1 Tax=Cytobacillus eiseniae TaxID=762947 RepID=A0ABS4RFD7_9BACI|nr:tryptophan transporter [Cytobacillus eiseniae]MBP2241080.1 hypothetical protein [Cytobacillus eiseniae]